MLCLEQIGSIKIMKWALGDALFPRKPMPMKAHRTCIHGNRWIYFRHERNVTVIIATDTNLQNHKKLFSRKRNHLFNLWDWMHINYKMHFSGTHINQLLIASTSSKHVLKRKDTRWKRLLHNLPSWRDQQGRNFILDYPAYNAFLDFLKKS